ncbi:hypothetical protein BER30_003130 [Clostridioides difficile]|nr:hypothetical protein BER30_003130 [Clostridioides difficile]
MLDIKRIRENLDCIKKQWKEGAKKTLTLMK